LKITVVWWGRVKGREKKRNSPAPKTEKRKCLEK